MDHSIFKPFKATYKQLEFIQELINGKYGDGITYLGEYGFYSNGNIGVLCKDQFGVFNIRIDKNGNPA